MGLGPLSLAGDRQRGGSVWRREEAEGHAARPGSAPRPALLPVRHRQEPRSGRPRLLVKIIRHCDTKGMCVSEELRGGHV